MTARNALSFIAGVAVTTSLLGMVAAIAGRVMTRLGGWPSYLIACVPIVMGLHLLGWLKLPLPALRTPRGGLGGSFLTGLLLSLVITPCGTPVLASVLSFAAYRHSVAYGGFLLLVYGLGAGVPVMLVGTVAGGLAQRLEDAGWRSWVDRATALAMIAFGFYLAWKAWPPFATEPMAAG